MGEALAGRAQGRFVNGLQIVTFEGMREAVRAAASARNFVAFEQHADTPFFLQPNLLAAEKDIFGGYHPEALPGKLVSRRHVAVVEHDDSGRQRKGVGAIGPLFPLLGDRIRATAGDRLQIEAAVCKRVEQATAMVGKEIA